jgi:hypothetical protein
MSEPWCWHKPQPPKGTHDFIVEVQRRAATYVGCASAGGHTGPDNLREFVKAEAALHFTTREDAEAVAVLFAATQKDPVVGHLRVLEFVWD